MGSRTFYLFRHGQTDWNAQDRAQGQTDIPLNEVGIFQARRLSGALKRLQLERIVSSDLGRAHQTAKIATAGLGIPISLDSRLRESNMGVIEGLTYLEIDQKFGPDLIKRWRSGLPEDQEVKFPGGESGREVFERVSAVLHDLCGNSNSEGAIGISTHGGVLRRLMEAYYPKHLPRGLVPNGCLFTLKFEPQAQKNWEFSHWFELHPSPKLG